MLSLNHLIVTIVKNLKCMLYFACRTRRTLLKCGRRLGCFIFSNLVVAKSEKADIRAAYLFSFCLSYILSSMSTCTINMSKCNKAILCRLSRKSHSYEKKIPKHQISPTCHFHMLDATYLC